jgi:hypothetical protein
MRLLLDFVARYFGFLYLDLKYRIVDSSTRGLSDIDASITFSSDRIKWDVINDRGQIYFAAVPLCQASDPDWFTSSLIRQYLEGGEDTGAGAPVEQANWLAENLSRVEQLFSDESTSTRSCEELSALRLSNSSKKWGWPKDD